MDDSEKAKDERPEDAAKKPVDPEELKDENLDQAAGGTVVGGALSDAIKSIGDALGSMARKG